MRGAEGGAPEGGGGAAMDSKASESRLATPSSGGRMSMKGSGIPVPVASGAVDNAKLRRITQEGRSHSTSRQRQQ